MCDKPRPLQDTVTGFLSRDLSLLQDLKQLCKPLPVLRGNFQVASKVAAQMRSVKPEMLSHLLLGHPHLPLTHLLETRTETPIIPKPLFS